eukprot:TRINITY_DN5840_c0_g1_i2.p1 TRINITY_DN5840_c0_g1~~TRINITY_DN5840_c0_g1_i2.p1  ORF type:complete len:402 (-),score=58.19 TRINITY_DN5840_c0_g1_i2:97-1302(-)
MPSLLDAARETWQIPPRYKVTEIIGSGSYGSVCEADDTGANPREIVAIKKCKGIFEDLVDCKRILREVSILSKLDHRNVVKIHDFHIPEEKAKFTEIYMIMELCDSDFKKLCRQDVSLSPIHINTLLYNLLVGLNYVHSAGVYHRDLKPANCFVNQDCTVKIGDFGLSRAYKGEQKHLGHLPHTPRGGETGMEPRPIVPHTKRARKNLTSHVVTRWYRAPELILLQDNYTEAIDVWSVGCIYAELMGMLDGKPHMERGPLFPGQSCFPLSPDHRHKADYKFYTDGKHDMLKKIFNMLGTPKQEEIDWVEREDAKRYIKCFAEREGDGLESVFKDAEPAMVDILNNVNLLPEEPHHGQGGYGSPTAPRYSRSDSRDDSQGDGGAPFRTRRTFGRACASQLFL